VWAGVSARAAPESAGQRGGYHEPPAAELRTPLKPLGGTPGAVFDDPDAWALFEPVVLAGLPLVDGRRPAPCAGPLPVVLSAYAGGADHSASPRRPAGWAEYAVCFPGLRVFDGGHFPFQDDPAPLLRRIARDAATTLDAAQTQAQSSAPSPR
jgi:surfactin synthase thioesterase subunit